MLLVLVSCVALVCGGCVGSGVGVGGLSWLMALVYIVAVVVFVWCV